MLPSRTITALVVDDDSGVRYALGLVLEDEGYQVAVAADGEQALACLAQIPVDIVLSDLQMPGMSGVALLLEMRRRGLHVPVLFMSAGTNAGAEAIAYGACGFLPKPFDLDRLLQTVSDVTSAREQHGSEVSTQQMSESENRVKVVVINSNDDLLRLLSEIGESAGFDVITAHTDEIGRDPEAIQQFLRRHNARVVVYDISPPYPENWELFRRVRHAEMVSGSWRQYVVTTPNKQALEEHVGTTQAIELVGDNLDRDAIAEAIRRGMLV